MIFPVRKSHRLFSNDPYLTAKCALNIYQNSVIFDSPLRQFSPENNPLREESDIKGFSLNARMRMMRMFAKIDYLSYATPLFISATFHNDFKLERIFVKKTLDNFLKRLKRNLPPFHHIWKLELQKRIAPHFHFMILFENKNLKINFSEIEKIIKKNWLELKMCDCVFCSEYSIDVRKVNDYKHAMIYISKEIAKVTQNKFKCDIGNYWNHSRKIRIKLYEKIDLSYVEMQIILRDYFLTESGKKINKNFQEKILNEPFSFSLFANINEIAPAIQNLLNARNERVNFENEFHLTKQQYFNLLNQEN